MGNWITITADDLYNTKAAPLIDQLRTAALASGQDDPTAGHIQGTVDRIRAEVGSNPHNQLDPDATTIPASLRDLAERLIVWRLQNRLNVFNAVEPSKQDEADHRDDVRYLERIASGEVVVEDALKPGALQSKGGVELVSGTDTRRASREQTDGL